MPRYLSRHLGQMLGLLLLLGAIPAMAANPPTLFTLSAGTPTVIAQGAQKSWPIKISEDQAFDAIFKGGMWLPNPSGGRIYAKYQRHILHDNGTWTWIGTVSTVHGEQSVVLTFGKGVVFGLVPQASGYPLRIVTRAGETRVVETSAAMSRSTQQLRLYSKPDYFVPPRVAPATHRASTMSAPASVPVQAAASGAVTIDVMVAYTPGFVSGLGSQHAALTRIQNLVDTTNQAYTASGVNQQIRLVDTVEVNYPDNTSNDSALDDLTGLDPNGNPVPIPASLQGIAALRVQYGADLVSLIRSYDNATQGNCGEGWLIGGNEQPIVPSQDNVWGYNVVSDGSNGGYYCLDTTFAHELGHNMGDAHDRANASNPGAYSYSYGYLGNGTNGFSTIMAYGPATDTPLAVFSNPDISTCQNTPCGVADSSPSSADNAHSMNNTAALIAAFEPTMVDTPPPAVGSVRNDVNGDGMSDLLWENSGSHVFGYWLMNGGSRISYRSMSDAGTGYALVAVGDLNGDGRADIVWAGNNNVVVWINNGNGSFTSSFVATFPNGWQLFGTGDINNDGNADLLWHNATTHQFGYWLMSGAQRLGFTSMADAGDGYYPAAVGDFNGDGAADIVWSSSKRDVVMWLNDGSGHFSSSYIATYPSGWQIVGADDINGDGDADLLWENPNSNLFGYWSMNGSTRLSYLSMTGPGKGYTIVAYGDYNGDGKTDVMWTSPGRNIYVWINDGEGAFSSSYIASYPTGWALAPMLSQ